MSNDTSRVALCSVILLLVLLSVLIRTAADVPIARLNGTAFLGSTVVMAFESSDIIIVGNWDSASLIRAHINGTVILAVSIGIDRAYDIALDTAGNVWSASYLSNTVTQYDRNFVRLQQWRVTSAFGVAVDSSYVYVAVRNNDAVSIYTLSGALVRSVNVGSKLVWDVALDAEGIIYAATTTDVVKFAFDGTILARFITVAPAVNHLISVVVDGDGTVYASDDYNDRIVQWFANGTVGHVYTSSDPPAFTRPWGLALQPVTDNIFASSSNYVFVFVAVNTKPTPPPPVSCSTGANAGGYDLSKLTVNGADLVGIDGRKERVYYWSVCGAVQNAECNQYAAGSSVCGLSQFVSSGVVVARPTTPIVWSFLPNTSSVSVTGVSGVVMNGAACGIYGLPSQLMIVLVCATAQDKLFTMDDSNVRASATICIYVLTLQTPLVCPVPNMHRSSNAN